MAEAAAELEFEQAARMRDRLATVRRAIERQQMVGDRNEDVDVIGVAEDELEAAAQVFFVRKGRVVGRFGFILDKVMDLTPDQTMAAVLEQVYGDEPAVGYPKAVLVPTIPEDVGHLHGVADREPREPGARSASRSAGPSASSPRPSPQNAAEAFQRHRLKRSSDHNSRAKALNDLEQYLELPAAPLRIECYDMSHLQGTDYVGSMVVLEDGLPRKSEYRRFKVHVPGNDDYGAMEEVLTRRLTAYVDRQGQAGRGAGQVRVSAAAAAGRRRQGPAAASR